MTHPTHPEEDRSTAYTNLEGAIEDANQQREAHEADGYLIRDLHGPGIVKGHEVIDPDSDDVVEQVRVHGCDELACTPHPEPAG